MKNLYQILGVLDTAEDIVIRAAYKALAQRYHPDKWQGNAEEATVRMSEINHAYRILSDPMEKAKYDRTIDKREYQEEPDIEENIDAYLDDAWKVGLVFFPELNDIYLRLIKTNYALGNTFKLIIIENKAFDSGIEIAKNMEHEFLIKYFGENQKIIQFVKLLIKNGDKKSVKLLNKYVDILGTSVAPEAIIKKVSGDINFSYSPISDAIYAYEKLASVKNAINVLKAFGYEITEDKNKNSLPFQSYTAIKDGLTHYYTSLNIRNYVDVIVKKYKEEDI